MTYNPEIWLESLTRTLKGYVEQGFDNAVLDASSDPVGLQTYEVVMEFPGAQLDDIKSVPLAKSIVHFEIDDVETSVIGFGENIFATNYDADASTLKPQEARMHIVNFDVGIWTTDTTGGSTARMRAFQILNTLFSGFRATTALRAYSDGGDGPVDITGFEGGKFVTERVNDINVYRTVAATLMVRVYSRTAEPSVPEPAISEFFVDELTIPIEEVDEVPVLKLGPFFYNTPNLNVGIPIYTPKIGDVLVDFAIGIDVAFNGGARGDVGQASAGSTGLYDQTGVNTGGFFTTANNFGGVQVCTPGLGEYGGMYVFTSTDPLLLWVAQSGIRGNPAPSSTQGSFHVYLSVTKPTN